MPEAETAAAKFRRIVHQLSDDILCGKYPPRRRLPSERALQQRFGVSRMTVRKAIEELTLRGFVYARQGKGTFVGDGRQHHETIVLLCPDTFPPRDAQLIRHELARLAEAKGHVLSTATTPAQLPALGATAVIFLNDPAEAHTDLPAVTIRCDPRRRYAPSRHDSIAYDETDARHLLLSHLKDVGVQHVQLSGPYEAVSLQSISEILLAHPETDAVLCPDGRTGTRVLTALEQLGLRVPEDVRVACLDDTEPALTGLSRSPLALAQTAFARLEVRLLNPDLPPCSLHLKPALRITSSTLADTNLG